MIRDTKMPPTRAKRMAERFRAERKDNGLTLQQVADIVGTTKSNIVHIEQGRQYPSVGVLYRFCVRFKVSPAWLLSLSKERVL